MHEHTHRHQPEQDRRPRLVAEPRGKQDQHDQYTCPMHPQIRRDEQVGDRLRVRPGEKVPVDGVVLEGRGRDELQLGLGRGECSAASKRCRVMQGMRHTKEVCIMKKMNLFALIGALTVVGATLGCNKETEQSAAPIASSQATPLMNEPAMHGMSAAAASGMSGSMLAANGNVMDQMRASCPLVSKGASVEVADTKDGVALTFSSKEGDAADLRARVQRMGQMYEMHRGHGSMMWHQMGTATGQMGTGNGMMGNGNGMGMGTGKGMAAEDGAGHMGESGPMPSAKATVEETGSGARLVLVPSDSAQLDALRQHVRMHQQRMQSGECWMLNQGAGSPEGAK